MWDVYMAFREPTSAERGLLAFLAPPSTTVIPFNWMDKLLVEEMSDGGMGSLRLQLHAFKSSNILATELSSTEFQDADGINVVATLYADENGIPFELDVWKTDFSALQTIPHPMKVSDTS